MAAVIAALHAIGFGVLVLVVAPARYKLGGGTFAVGTGITAYTLGLRHAFDADHISAIDNTTRKLMSEGQRPLGVGFFFSLGHSSVVFALALLLSLGVRTLGGSVRNGHSTLHGVTSVLGTTVSGVFLLAIAAVNSLVLVGILRLFFAMRGGTCDEPELERQLRSRGLMNRFLGRFAARVRRSWHMYPVGILFGLGFDTASEVALLVLAAGAGAAGLPWYGLLCLPVLFTAGMSLLDTIDGSFMNFAYGWAFSRPVRKIYYNITITGLSIAIALFIGGVELGGLLSQELGATGAFARWLQTFDINRAGLVIAGAFVVTWAGALLLWRVARIEQRWAGAAQRSAAAGGSDLSRL
ncbi:MAG TPA: HoxN/HupN/NixA family nickel/cobalt transporter [Solirubrobacteraceae bacterium]|jgi:high-affinity nickel-transport protein|nr:HoxN/HupN/NixA family nickel/cobalt transporter [Solirubrobacteraceae bacterium]